MSMQISRRVLSAMDKEMENMKNNNVCDLIPLPKGKKTVQSKWVFKEKLGVNGDIVQCKV